MRDGIAYAHNALAFVEQLVAHGGADGCHRPAECGYRNDVLHVLYLNIIDIPTFVRKSETVTGLPPVCTIRTT